MSRGPTSVVIVLLAVLAGSCALEATGTAPTSSTTAGSGATSSGGTGGDPPASTATGGTATGGGAATGGHGAGTGPTTGSGAGGSDGTGGETASSSGGGGGGEPPTCGDGIVEGGEECDGPAPCDRCVMVCPGGWTRGATGTCYGVAESDADGDEIVAACDATREQVAIDAAVVLRPGTPDVLADLATVSLVCGDELGDDGCWIGADDRDVEGTFRWVSGETFAYASGLSPWAEGEPSGDDDDENCVEVHLPDGGDRPLHDDDCWRSQRVICEIVPPGVPAD